MIVKENWLTPDNQVNLYLQSVEDALKWDYRFSMFKQDRRYQIVLEHVSETHGASLWKFLTNKVSKNIISEFTFNDSVGTPRVYNYDGVIISPTTLRYIKSFYYLKELFGSLNGFKILEIGGGYGGLCSILNQAYDIENYTIADLPQVCNLQKKYIETLWKNKEKKINFTTISSMSDLIDCQQYDLVISEFALSELDMDIQEKYIDKISSIKRGYIASNACYDRAVQFFNKAKMYNNFDFVKLLKSQNASLRGIYDSHPSGEIEDLGLIYWGSACSEKKMEAKKGEYYEVVHEQLKASNYDKEKINWIVNGFQENKIGIL